MQPYSVNVKLFQMTRHDHRDAAWAASVRRLRRALVAVLIAVVTMIAFLVYRMFQ